MELNDLPETADALADLIYVIVGFALETDNEERGARAKAKKKNCDIIVVNNPTVEGAAFAHDTNVVAVYDENGLLYRSDAPESKRELARRILELASNHAAFKQILI